MYVVYQLNLQWWWNVIYEHLHLHFWDFILMILCFSHLLIWLLKFLWILSVWTWLLFFPLYREYESTMFEIMWISLITTKTKSSNLTLVSSAMNKNNSLQLSLQQSRDVCVLNREINNRSCNYISVIVETIYFGGILWASRDISNEFIIFVSLLFPMNRKCSCDAYMPLVLAFWSNNNMTCRLIT
jgi:hypothetical protein